MAVLRKRCKLITPFILLLVLLPQSLGQSTQSVLTGMWTSHTSLWQIKTSGFILANGKVDIDKKMEVNIEHSFPLAKLPWVVTRHESLGEDSEDSEDSEGSEGSEGSEDSEDSEDSEEEYMIDGKVIFRLNTAFMQQDTFLKERDYTQGKILGKGGNGQVYEVSIQKDRSKKVVVKTTTYIIKKEEVEVYKLLGDHNHIVKHLGGTFSKNGHARIFMEQCDDSLYNYMKNTLKRRLSLAEAMFYWLQIREAVEYLHDRGIIHKDIKSENVLIMMKGRRVLLCDFDSAKMLRNDLTEKGLESLGTDGFISPEVLARASHGRPADIFSMGCWLIEMTIGSPGNNSLRGKIEMLRNLDPELAELVEACVSKRPEDRPTARSLLDWPVVKRYMGEGEVGRSQDQ